MAPSNLFTHIFLLLAFTATIVPGEGKLRLNLSEELGLTHSCAKRVLATCCSSLLRSVHTPEERSCDSPQTEGLVEALKESSSSREALLQKLKEWLGTNTEQEQSLRDMKSDVQFRKEVASKSATTMSQSLKEVERTNQDERHVLEDLAKISLQDSVISELQKSLNNLELKMSEQDNTKKIDEILNFLTVIKEAEDSDTKQQDLLQSLKTPLFIPLNCADLLNNGDNETGVREVYPFQHNKSRPVSVFCIQTTGNGGWTEFLHRINPPGRSNYFSHTWKMYQGEFGDIEGEFWLGLNNTHALVTGTPMELRLDLEDFDGQKKWAKYEVFSIEDAAGKYRLHLEGHSGDIGDFMKEYNGMMFSTMDQDNDNDIGNCAELKDFGWWYDDCHPYHLNRLFAPFWTFEPFDTISMKLRPKFRN